MTHTCIAHGSKVYNTSMLDIYRGVTASSYPNFMGARLPLPYNFIFHEWEAIVHSQVDHEVLHYLKYGFPVGFEGPFPTLSFGNHPSAINHPRDVKAYITTEIAERTILGPFL